MINPKLTPIQNKKIDLLDITGSRIQSVTKNWLLTVVDANPAILEMFADRDFLPYRDMLPWAGEFVGKYLTSAVQVWRITDDHALYEQINRIIQMLSELQGEDGYLGPWAANFRLTNFSPFHGENGLLTWDTWGHYHIMLGLIYWYESTGDASALDIACRMADLICEKYLGDKSPLLVETGSTEMNLAPVHSLALLYRLTGKDSYRRMSLQIVDEFARLKDGEYLAGNYLQGALAGQDFYQLPKPRWESLHPIMGLVEWYWITGDDYFRQAFEKIWWSIVKYDRHNNGGFSSGEKATGNPFDPNPIETCCTIAWTAMSVEMLKLTADSYVADEIEFTFLNSIIGMHAISGRWATYNTPSDGVRYASAHHIVGHSRSGSPELNCCSVNSPRGLGMVGDWAVMSGENGIYLNYYGSSRFLVPVDEVSEVEIVQETDYPRQGKVLIHINPTQACEFALNLRIPHWSGNTRVLVNNEQVQNIEAGTYLKIFKTWQSGDQVTIELDMGLRFWRGERQCQGLTSIYRGPILLAYDQRYNRHLHTKGDPRPYGGDPAHRSGDWLNVMPLTGSDLTLTPSTWDGWMPPTMLFQVSLKDGRQAYLCDFASAGQTGSLYRSWLPLE